MKTHNTSNDVDRLRSEYAQRQQQATRNTYSIFNPAHLFARQQRERVVLKLLYQRGFVPLSNYSLLELGCGSGGVLTEFQGYGATTSQLHGIDLLPYRLREAQSHLPLARFECADGQCLPYPTHTFDLVLQFTAFSSLLDETVKTNLATEMLRVLRQTGLIIWYDFWLNPTNPHTRGIRPNEIRRLFPGCQFTFQRITLAPPIARRLIPLSWLTGMALEKLTVFNTHYLVAIPKL